MRRWRWKKEKKTCRGNKPRSEIFRLCLGAFLSPLYIPGGLPLPLLKANGYFRLPPTSGSGRVPGTHRQALSLAAGAQIFRRRHLAAEPLFSSPPPAALILFLPRKRMRGAELRSPPRGEKRIATPVCAPVRNDKGRKFRLSPIPAARCRICLSAHHSFLSFS